MADAPPPITALFPPVIGHDVDPAGQHHAGQLRPIGSLIKKTRSSVLSNAVQDVVGTRSFATPTTRPSMNGVVNAEIQIPRLNGAPCAEVFHELDPVALDLIWNTLHNDATPPSDLSLHTQVNIANIVLRLKLASAPDRDYMRQLIQVFAQPRRPLSTSTSYCWREWRPYSADSESLLYIGLAFRHRDLISQNIHTLGYWTSSDPPIDGRLAPTIINIKELRNYHKQLVFEQIRCLLQDESKRHRSFVKQMKDYFRKEVENALVVDFDQDWSSPWGKRNPKRANSERTEAFCSYTILRQVEGYLTDPDLTRQTNHGQRSLARGEVEAPGRDTSIADIMKGIMAWVEASPTIPAADATAFLQELSKRIDEKVRECMRDKKGMVQEMLDDSKDEFEQAQQTCPALQLLCGGS